MRWPAFLVLLLLASLCRVTAGETIRLGADGSVSGCLLLGSGDPRNVTLRFGLPRIAAVKQWSDGPAQVKLWVTNGIRYTQTVLLTSATLHPERPDKTAKTTPVLLVNIEGENTNSEYAEAFATLALEVDGRLQQLELRGGSVLRQSQSTTNLVAALEIPESGVKLASGELLRFSGSIPPSLKGSMTLKVALERLDSLEAEDRLRELDFETTLRQARKPDHAPAPAGHTLSRESQPKS
jgi:hypothetical protein